VRLGLGTDGRVLDMVWKWAWWGEDVDGSGIYQVYCTVCGMVMK